jgi:D-sedoheptulose 7-phosphate isomerase
MSEITREHLAEHVEVVTALSTLLPAVDDLAARIRASLEAGGKVLAFGNGGSAADAQHLAAELIGRYQRTRRPLAALSLVVDPSVVSCIANDFAYFDVFARQVEGLARAGDVVVGFTTSGTSASVVNGLAAGRAAGATTVLFGGGTGGTALAEADVALLVPSTTTARIQEMHLLLLHLLSEELDRWAAGAAGGTRA